MLSFRGKGRLLEFVWKMKTENYSNATITNYGNAIKNLVESHVDILSPEHVKAFLAKQACSEAHKHVIAAAYTLFLSMNGLTWKPPRCHVEHRVPFIPTEGELDSLISGCGRKTSAYLQVLKETGMRAGEPSTLRWKDVDLQQRILTLNKPEKCGTPRIFDISSKLANMLAALPKTSEYLFGSPNKNSRTVAFYRQRKMLVRKLGNPRLLDIHLHTFRHWKATMLYHETKNPMLVKEFLGHISLDVTALYIHLDKRLFKESNDCFIVKAIRDADEIAPLLEIGYEYHCQKDSLMFFRKRK